MGASQFAAVLACIGVGMAVSGVASDLAPARSKETFSLSIASSYDPVAEPAPSDSFNATPAARHEDPGGLLALWGQYEEKVIELILARRASTGSCETLHCIVPFGLNPDLLSYLELFEQGVAEYEDELYEIAESNESPQNRAFAIFLLAHSQNSERLLRAASRAMYDRNALVRNNAMRVMAAMAERNPDMDFPIADLVQAMDFPAITDGNKAAFTLGQLATSERYRQRIAELAVPAALRLLRSEHPLAHDPAYELLRRISGEDFGARDYQAWEDWALRR